MRRVGFVLGLALVWTGALGQPAGFVIDSPVSGLTQPTSIAFAPNGRLFVAEKQGVIKVFNGSNLVGPFATIACSSNSERGVLGLALDPNFTSNRFVYVYYTTQGPNPKNRVSRFTELNNQAVPGSELVIVDDIPSDAGNHNAGCLRFGIDGKLYIGTGDGGSTPSNSQDLSSLAGKVLRVNPDGSVPGDNPFFGQPGKRGEVFAFGLRNPFRMAFRPGTLSLFIADVGQNAWEEINVGLPGGNFGWPLFEGIVASPGYLDPIYQYSHNSQSASITGGVFAGSAWPLEFQNRYLFGDFILNSIRWIEVDASNSTVAAGSFATITSPVDFAPGPDGAIYVVDFGGTVHRIAYRPRVSALTAPNVYSGNSANGTVTLDVDAPTAGLTVQLSSSNSGVVSVPTSVIVPAGDDSASFTLQAGTVPATQSSVVTATVNGASKSKTVFVLPPKLTSHTLGALAVVGGTATTGQVSVIGKAPAGGTSVSLSSANPTVVQVPPSATILSGASTSSYGVTTSIVTVDTNVSVTATLGSTYLPRTLSVVVQLHRISSLTLTPNPVVSGSGTVGRIAINRPAPNGGLAISLNDNASIVAVPSTVTIPAGATVTTFPVSTTAVNTPYNVTIQGIVGISVRNATLTVLPSPIRSLGAFPSTIPGGLPSTGQVVLTDPAPVGGAVVALGDGSPWASLPPNLVIPVGETTSNFSISTLPVTQNVVVTFSAALSGSTRTSTFTITNVAALASLVLTPTVLSSGQTSEGTVLLTKNAPVGGIEVVLSDTLSVLTVPSSVRVGSGAKSQTFFAVAGTVSATAIGTVIATSGGITRTSTITINP